MYFEAVISSVTHSCLCRGAMTQQMASGTKRTKLNARSTVMETWLTQTEYNKST